MEALSVIYYAKFCIECHGKVMVILEIQKKSECFTNMKANPYAQALRPQLTVEVVYGLTKHTHNWKNLHKHNTAKSNQRMPARWTQLLYTSTGTVPR